MSVAEKTKGLAVCEIFTSIQGEGTRIGVASTFVRLGGCNLRCAWCLDEDSRVLMSDYSEKRLGDLKLGDEVIAADRAHGNRRLTTAVVTHLAKSIKPCITLRADDAEVVLTPDHQLWKAARSDWAPAENLLGHEVRFLGRPASLTLAYRQGYLAGSADGDGTFWTLNKGEHSYRRFRIATNDDDILERFASCLDSVGFGYTRGKHSATGFSGEPRTCNAVYLTSAKVAEALESLVGTDLLDVPDWRMGYLAGLFDTDGTTSGGRSLRWTQQKEPVINRLCRVLSAHGLSFEKEPGAIRLKGETPLSTFAMKMAPACMRKLNSLVQREARGRKRVTALEPAGDRTVVTVTTSTGSYVANGFLVKNCDTSYSWAEGSQRDWLLMTPAEIALQVAADDVVITGGEPMLHDLEPLLEVLGERHVTVETNATIFRPYERVDLWSLSPKLGSSGQRPNRPVIGKFLDLWPDRTQLKFVVDGPADLEEVLGLLYEFPVVRAASVPVVIQPVGLAGEAPGVYMARFRAIIESSLLASPAWKPYHWRALPQLHRLVWGEARGV